MSSPPKPPSATSLVSGQMRAGTQAAEKSGEISGKLSNQSTPFGTLNYVMGPDGKMTAVQDYSAPEKALFNMFTGAGGFQPTALSGGLNSLQSFLNSTGGTGVPNLSDTATGLTGQLVGQQTAAVEPQMAWMQQNLDNQLRNQGITPGSPAYDRAMQTLYAGQGQAIAGFQAQFEPQAYEQAYKNYMLPFNTASALAQMGAPAGLSGTWSGTPTVSENVAAPNSMAAQLSQYQAQANAAGGPFQLAGTLLGSNAGQSALSGIFGSLAGGAGDVGLGSWAPMLFL